MTPKDFEEDQEREKKKRSRYELDYEEIKQKRTPAKTLKPRISNVNVVPEISDVDSEGRDEQAAPSPKRPRGRQRTSSTKTEETIQIQSPRGGSKKLNVGDKVLVATIINFPKPRGRPTIKSNKKEEVKTSSGVETKQTTAEVQGTQIDMDVHNEDVQNVEENQNHEEETVVDANASDAKERAAIMDKVYDRMDKSCFGHKKRPPKPKKVKVKEESIDELDMAAEMEVPIVCHICGDQHESKGKIDITLL